MAPAHRGDDIPLSSRTRWPTYRWRAPLDGCAHVSPFLREERLGEGFSDSPSPGPLPRKGEGDLILALPRLARERWWTDGGLPRRGKGEVGGLHAGLFRTPSPTPFLPRGRT